MTRENSRPPFIPNTSGFADTPDAQEAEHIAHWDRQHDIELAKKLKKALTEKGLEVHSDRGDTTRLIIEVVKELRLTQE